MKNCVIKSEHTSIADISTISSSLKSILGLNPESSSSSESLVALLDATIEDQQARFRELSQNTMSQIRHMKEDAEELEILVNGALKNFEGQESPKKKKKKDREITESELDENLPKKHKKRKHKHSSISEAEEVSEKPKKKKHHDSDIEKIRKLKSCSPVFGSDKKSKKKKHKQSSASEAEADHEKINLDSSDLVKKIKKKKTHKHSISETEGELPEKIKGKNKHNLSSVSEAEGDHENMKSVERIKSKKKHKHSSVSEPDDNEKLNLESKTPENVKKKKKLKLSSISEAEDNNEKLILDNDNTKKIKRKKKLKFSSISEAEDNHDLAEKIIPKKKHKHSSVSEVEIDPEPDKNKRRKKHKHPSISEAEDNQEKIILVNDNTKKIKRKKKHKHSSISEMEDSAHESKNEEKLNKLDSEDIKNENHDLMETHEDSGSLNITSGSIKANKVKSKTKIKESPSKKQYLSPKSDSSSDTERLEPPNVNSLVDFINESLETATERKQLDHTDIVVLKDLCIFIPWELPKSHTIETRLSHPTYEQYKQFRELNFPMKSGPYNKEEDQKIKDNWEDFSRVHDLKISPSAFLPVEGETRSLLATEQRIKFVQFLGKGLEDRTLSSIYNRFHLLFKPYKKGRFSPEEDNIILTFIETSTTPNKYSALSTILNRRRELIKARHGILLADDEKIKWNMSLYQDVLNNLLTVTKLQNIDDLKDFHIEMVHWKNVGKRMDIQAVKIRRKWLLYLYPRLFGDNFNSLNDIRMKLVNMLYDNKEDDKKKINWNELAKSFDGMTNSRLYKIFSDMVGNYVPDANKSDFRGTIKHLKEMIPHMLLQKKRLSKFMHRDGQLFDCKTFEPVVTF